MNKRVVYIQYTNPGGYPPLEHSAFILANDGWKILFLGCESYGAGNLEFPYHANICVRKLRFMPAGLQQKLHYICYMIWVLGWMIYWRPSWVYASDPLSCPIALLLSYIPKLKVAYHEHDSPTLDSVQQATGFMHFVLAKRRALALRAECCIFPTQGRAIAFRESTGSKGNTITVWNCPSQSEVRTATANNLVPLKLYYHGSLGEGLLPFTIIEAMALIGNQVELYAVGYETIGTQGYTDKLLRVAEQHGLGKQVHIMGPLSRHELLRVAQQHHIGLALMPMTASDINYKFMAGASNKAFDYLACGLTLLVSDEPAWRAMYVEAGYGLACDPNDPKSIAAALQWFMEHPIERQSMGKQGQQRILEEWNYEKQFMPVYKLINHGEVKSSQRIEALRPR